MKTTTAKTEAGPIEGLRVTTEMYPVEVSTLQKWTREFIEFESLCERTDAAFEAAEKTLAELLKSADPGKDEELHALALAKARVDVFPLRIEALGAERKELIARINEALPAAKHKMIAAVAEISRGIRLRKARAVREHFPSEKAAFDVFVDCEEVKPWSALAFNLDSYGSMGLVGMDPRPLVKHAPNLFEELAKVRAEFSGEVPKVEG